MHRYFGPIGALALVMSAVLLPAQRAHADDAAVRKALEKQYKKIEQAYKSKDLKPAMDVSTPDYSMSLPNGQVVTRVQAENQFNMTMSFVQAVTGYNVKINKLSVRGNQATAETQDSLSGIVNDPQTQGKTHSLKLVNYYHDTWVKVGGNWLRKHSSLLSGTINNDGKTSDLGATINKMTNKMQNQGGMKK